MYCDVKRDVRKPWHPGEVLAMPCKCYDTNTNNSRRGTPWQGPWPHSDSREAIARRQVDIGKTHHQGSNTSGGGGGSVNLNAT